MWGKGEGVPEAPSVGRETRREPTASQRLTYWEGSPTPSHFPFLVTNAELEFPVFLPAFLAVFFSFPKVHSRGGTLRLCEGQGFGTLVPSASFSRK